MIDTSADIPSNESSKKDTEQSQVFSTGQDKGSDSDIVYDLVARPRHYNQGDIECIDYIKDRLGEEFKNYLFGSIIKYIHRHPYKGNPVEDLRKAKWYLHRLIEEYANDK